MARAYDVAVVGAGVAGAWAALHLARRGLRVFLAAPEGVLGGPASLAAGIVTTQLAEPHLSWALRSLELYREAGVARRVRAVWIAPWEVVDSVLAALGERGIPCGPLDEAQATELAGVEVRTPPGLKAAFTEDALLDLSALASWLSTQLERLGVEVSPCRALAASGGSVDCGSHAVEAGEVIVAAGPWTPGVLGVPPERLGLTVYRCQASSVDLPGLKAPVYVDLDSGDSAYAVPESPATAVVGDGPNDPLRDPGEATPLPEAPYEALETLSTALPAALEASPRTSWAAPCILAGDGYPLLGRPWRGAPLVFTGLNGYGLMVAPALAEILARHVADGEEIPGEVRASRPLEPWRGGGPPPEPYRTH
ncbi:NAD(P)/FAD-dependent oxidoreductase [Stetteria hydrogenophila]